ncbi:hypothetical protein LQZ19_18195 [Treponema primitia]|uniref:hypothetical protein n=1 Tax=Treponema primitia TaxID=88058 RepID=UPI00397F26D1
MQLVAYVFQEIRYEAVQPKLCDKGGRDEGHPRPNTLRTYGPRNSLLEETRRGSASRLYKRVSAGDAPHPSRFADKSGNSYPRTSSAQLVVCS